MTSDQHRAPGMTRELEGVRHTPGPWVAFERETASNIYSKGNDGSLLAVVHSYSHGMPGRPDAPQREANARLIAAAPDYDQAAHMMVDALGCAPDEVIEGAFGDDVLAALQALRAAISKAEGRKT